MKFTTQLIGSRYMIDREVQVFLIIVFLYRNGIINRTKLKSMFTQHREGTLLRKVNTYHCSINDKWYNYEDMWNILLDVYEKSHIVVGEITLNEMIEYLQIYKNKNRNYCIDIIYSWFIQPLISRYSMFNTYEINELIKSFGVHVNGFNDVTLENYDRSFGYCCEDCDGDFKEYQSYRYDEYVVKSNKESLLKGFEGYLNTQRNQSYLKNPTRI